MTFPCNVSGTPPSRIMWFHNGEEVLPSTTGRIQMNSINELKFTRLQFDDRGNVQCLATNDAGQKISTATLVVKGKLSRKSSRSVKMLYKYYGRVEDRRNQRLKV